MLAMVGFSRIAEEWWGVYWNDQKNALLVVYVDDFKLAARAQDHNQIWKDLRSVISMDAEEEDGRFLGCTHERFQVKILVAQPSLLPCSWVVRRRGDSLPVTRGRPHTNCLRHSLQYGGVRKRMRKSIL
jgi:hypothetical protein